MTGKYWPHMVIACIVLTAAAFAVIGVTVVGLKSSQDKIVRNVTNVQRDVTNVTRVVSESPCTDMTSRECGRRILAALTRADREKLRGPRGYRGKRGRTGATGARGPRGFTGARGVQGPRGFAGPIGRVGPGGPGGPPGPAGQNAPPVVAPTIVPPGQGGTPPGLTPQPNKGNGPQKRKGGKP